MTRPFRRPSCRAALLAVLSAILPLAMLSSAAIPGARPAVAASPLLPGVGAEDPRARVDVAAAPWRALGRVQTELGGRCTGALIAPDRVLTAAHCLVSPRAGTLVRPSSVHFLRGYRMGEWTGQARVTAFTVGPGFDAARRGPPAADWALLTLERPLGRPEEALPLARAMPPPGTALLLGGYQQDRPELLMADTGCRVLATAPLLLHDCTGTRGASGAPLLLATPAGWAIAGVAVGVARDRPLGLAGPAVSLPPPPPALP